MRLTRWTRVGWGWRHGRSACAGSRRRGARGQLQVLDPDDSRAAKASPGPVPEPVERVVGRVHIRGRATVGADVATRVVTKPCQHEARLHQRVQTLNPRPSPSRGGSVAGLHMVQHPKERTAHLAPQRVMLLESEMYAAPPAPAACEKVMAELYRTSRPPVLTMMQPPPEMS